MGRDFLDAQTRPTGVVPPVQHPKNERPRLATLPIWVFCVYKDAIYVIILTTGFYPPSEIAHTTIGGDTSAIGTKLTGKNGITKLALI